LSLEQLFSKHLPNREWTVPRTIFTGKKISSPLFSSLDTGIIRCPSFPALIVCRRNSAGLSPAIRANALAHLGGGASTAFARWFHSLIFM
jgi:hypothetical protein